MNDSWFLPDDEKWTERLQMHAAFLLGKCLAANSHSYISFDGNNLKTHLQDDIKIHTKTAVSKAAALQDWFNAVIAMNRDELMGHEVQAVIDLTVDISVAISGAQVVNNFLAVDMTEDELLLITPIDSNLLEGARENAHYIMQEFSDHAGYDCDRRDYHNNV